MESGLTTHQLSEELDQQRGSRQLFCGVALTELVGSSRQEAPADVQKRDMAATLASLSASTSCGGCARMNSATWRFSRLTCG